MVGRIDCQCETELVKADTVAGTSYSDNMMPMNQDGANEDLDMARNFEGACWEALETVQTLAMHSEKG